jgi:hypothetical protein
VEALSPHARSGKDGPGSGAFHQSEREEKHNGAPK